MIQLDTNGTRRVQRHRKVYYAYYDARCEPYPYIRLGGRYLQAYGFMIGDTIEVLLDENRITITKHKQALRGP